MKIQRLLLSTLICSMLVLCAHAQDTKLLLVGNSLTGTYNLKATIQGLGTTRGYSFSVDVIWTGGYTLQQHWNDGVGDTIAAGDYDFVSLQDHSYTAWSDTNRPAFETVVPQFDQIITNNGGQTILYMTWGYSQYLPDYSMYDDIDQMYSDMGTQIGAKVMPGGRGFRNVLLDKTSSYLYNDHVHPSATGVYLVACLYYCVIFNESPEGIEFYTVNYGTIDPADAAYLQTEAWETYQEYIVPSPGDVQLDAPQYAAGEDQGSVVITVNRVGGSSGAISIEYAASDGTATAGSDYTGVSGTLSWADGDTEDKTFTVSVLDDTIDESDETIMLILSNPSGGADLRNPSTAMIIITDNDEPVDNTPDAPDGIEITYPNLKSISDGQPVQFQLAGTEGNSRLRIFTVSGKLVRVFTLNEGETEINWDLLNDQGVNIRPGLYMYALVDSAGNKKTGKIAITR